MSFKVGDLVICKPEWYKDFAQTKGAWVGEVTGTRDGYNDFDARTVRMCVGGDPQYHHRVWTALSCNKFMLKPTFTKGDRLVVTNEGANYSTAAKIASALGATKYAGTKCAPKTGDRCTFITMDGENRCLVACGIWEWVINLSGLELCEDQKPMRKYAKGDRVEVIHKGCSSFGKTGTISMVDTNMTALQYCVDYDGGPCGWQKEEYISLLPPKPAPIKAKKPSIAALSAARKRLCDFNPGNIVEVIDTGAMYTTYEDMAKKLGCTKWHNGESAFHGGIYHYVKDCYDPDEDTVYCMIRGEKGTEYIIGPEGLKLVPHTMSTPKVRDMRRKALKPIETETDEEFFKNLGFPRSNPCGEIPLGHEGIILKPDYKYKKEKEFLADIPAPVKLKQQKEPKVAKTMTERVKDAAKKVSTSQCGIAKTAATLEAARILNTQLVKIASKKLPIMVRGYADTAIGRAVIANALFMGMEVAFPEMSDNDIRKQVARAAVVQAYSEFLADFKAEDMLDELFNMPALKKLTDKIGASEEE